MATFEFGVLRLAPPNSRALQACNRGFPRGLKSLPLVTAEEAFYFRSKVNGWVTGEDWRTIVWLARRGAIDVICAAITVKELLRARPCLAGYWNELHAVLDPLYREVDCRFDVAAEFARHLRDVPATAFLPRRVDHPRLQEIIYNEETIRAVIEFGTLEQPSLELTKLYYKAFYKLMAECPLPQFLALKDGLLPGLTTASELVRAGAPSSRVRAPPEELLFMAAVHGRVDLIDEIDTNTLIRRGEDMAAGIAMRGQWAAARRIVERGFPCAGPVLRELIAAGQAGGLGERALDAPAHADHVLEGALLAGDLALAQRALDRGAAFAPRMYLTLAADPGRVYAWLDARGFAPGYPSPYLVRPSVETALGLHRHGVRLGAGAAVSLFHRGDYHVIDALVREGYAPDVERLRDAEYRGGESLPSCMLDFLDSLE